MTVQGNCLVLRAPDVPDDERSADELIQLAAELLVRGGGPDAGKQLMDEHGPDRRGRCRGCPHAGTVAPMYPCRLRLIGEAVVSGNVDGGPGGER